MKRIVHAHRLRHVVETKAGTVGFGFLVAARPEASKAALRERRLGGVRAPRGRTGVGRAASMSTASLGEN